LVLFCQALKILDDPAALINGFANFCMSIFAIKNILHVGHASGNIDHAHFFAACPARPVFVELFPERVFARAQRDHPKVLLHEVLSGNILAGPLLCRNYSPRVGWSRAGCLGGG
jgi:hypothetical protein